MVPFKQATERHIDGCSTCKAVGAVMQINIKQGIHVSDTNKHKIRVIQIGA